MRRTQDPDLSTLKLGHLISDGDIRESLRLSKLTDSPLCCPAQFTAAGLGHIF